MPLHQKTALLPRYYIDLFSASGASQPDFLQSVTADNNLNDFLLMNPAQADQLIDQAVDIYRDCPELVVTTGLELHKSYANNFFIWMMASDNIYQLLQRLNALSFDRFVDQVITGPDKITMQFVNDSCLDDSIVVFGVSCIAGLVGTTLPGASITVDLISGDQKYAGFLEQYSDIYLRYNQASNRITINYSNVCQSSLITTNPVLDDLLANSHQLKEIALKQDIVFQVQDIVRNTLHNPSLSISDVARILCMSPRTLQRKLQEKQQTFQNILNYERKTRAIQLMQDKTLDRLFISERVGFQDIRSLYRLLNR